MKLNLLHRRLGHDRDRGETHDAGDEKPVDRCPRDTRFHR
jgi:hypothetical protein